MNSRRLRFWSRWCVGVTLSLLPPASLAAQNPPQQLVTRAVDESKRVTLPGTRHPLAQPRFDQGAVPDSFAADRMLLMLSRPPDREQALRQFLTDVHTPGSPSHHHWVTPDEFAERFGPADSDIQAVVQWLRSHGFTVARVTKSRRFLEFSGTAAMVRDAFRTEIHHYNVNGEEHYANSADLAIPEALAPLIRAVSPLNDFYAQPMLHTVGPASYTPSTGRATPLFTDPNGRTEFFAVAPEDLATQYDLSPLYNAGTNGAGQTIGIINRSNVDISFASAYRTIFGLASNPPQVVIDGDDPGVGADRIEAYLDVEVSGAIAPNATVDLYIGNGSGVQDGLLLAALRAVEDNQASVLSISYGQCELLARNQFWSDLWEQAAAQGQTVFVSSGDSGPAFCPVVTDTSGVNVSPGLTVNGLASTPWNVAVGGTDFFYPDYASGAPSAPTFWNTTNDSKLGSLIAPLPEQPWSNALGLNAVSLFSANGGVSIGGGAGGGGVSNCSQVSLTASGPSCVAGYSKPAWQNAPGVPSDGARDIPDVSLFAATGYNFSAYPICARPGDCAGTLTSPSTVTLVGGTSASSPAMAGILSLVNQRFGRQGQADFTLYALARQQPSVFHDITLGNNDTFCLPSLMPACNTPLPNGVFGAMSYGVYAAGPGYDLASGLGSVDASALVNNWNKISFLPTATTLSLSPTSIVHGTPVTFTATVAPSSGSGTPSGDVDISIASPQPLPKSGAVPVVNGIATESVDFFPGGTYQVTAKYAGDGTYAPSSSTPLSLTVTPEASVVTPVVNYSAIGITLGSDVQSGQQVPFGSRWTFEAAPASASAGASGLATGTVTFTDGTTSTQVPIGSDGNAAAIVPSLALGQHSVSVSYSGDASYNASSGGPLTFTVVQGTPQIRLIPDLPQIFSNGSPVPYPAGTNLTISVLIGTGRGVAPTGNISVTLGTTTQTVPLSSLVAQGTIWGNAEVTFTNLQPGSFTLSASYSGDSNWTSAAYTAPNPIGVATVTVIPTTTTLTATPTSVNSQGSVTLVATVQAGAGATGPPVGPVFFSADGVAVAGTIAQSPSGTSATATVVLAATALPKGTSQITASYIGLPLTGATGFGPSNSAPVSVNYTPTDFRIAFDENQIAVRSGQSGSATLRLSPVNGSAVNVSFGCLPASGEIGCTMSPPTAMVSSATTVTATINAYVMTGAELLPLSPRRSQRIPPGLIALLAFVLSLVVLLSGRRIPSRLRWACSCGLLALLLSINGCGGGAGPSGPPPPIIQKIPATPGTYAVVVTASANGVIHNAKLTIVVQ